MTLDLDAIRARDAECGPFADWPPDGLDARRAAEMAAGAIVDRRDLLAEVDRLTLHIRNLATLTGAIRDAERARIRAAVEGLRTHQPGGYEWEWDCQDEYLSDHYPSYCPDPYEAHDQLVDRAAVLAAIDGGEHD